MAGREPARTRAGCKVTALMVGFWAALGAYVAWSAASCLWAAWPYGARSYLAREATFYFLCFAASALLITPQRWMSFARLFLFAALIAALWQGAYLVFAYAKGCLLYTSDAADE